MFSGLRLQSKMLKCNAASRGEFIQRCWPFIVRVPTASVETASVFPVVAH